MTAVSRSVRTALSTGTSPQTSSRIFLVEPPKNSPTIIAPDPRPAGLEVSPSEYSNQKRLYTYSIGRRVCGARPRTGGERHLRQRAGGDKRRVCNLASPARGGRRAGLRVGPEPGVSRLERTPPDQDLPLGRPP